MILAFGIAAQVTLTSCTVPDTTGNVRCGQHRVWEDRETRSGCQIDLSVIVLRATETPREPDPLFVLAGGPGQAASQIAGFSNGVFADVRRRRDIVLLDLRGTGASHPLTCPENAELPQSGIYDADWLPPAAVKRCRERLERKAVKITLARGLLGEAFRNLLYSPSTAARAPAIVSALARGDYAPIAPIALQTRTLTGTALSVGFFLSVSCTEACPSFAMTMPSVSPPTRSAVPIACSSSAARAISGHEAASRACEVNRSAPTCPC